MQSINLSINSNQSSTMLIALNIGIALYTIQRFSKSVVFDLLENMSFTSLLHPVFLLLLPTIILIVYCIVFISSRVQKNTNINIYFSLIFVGFALIFLNSLLLSTNFITLFCAIEGLGLLTLFILAQHFYNMGARELFFKYFCFNAFSAIIFLSSILILYVLTFSLDFITIKLVINSMIALSLLPSVGTSYIILNYFFLLLNMSIFLLLLSLFFKLGVYPFHIVVPDIYQYSSTYFLLYYNFLLKLFYFLVFIYFSYYLFIDVFYMYADIFMFMGLCSIISGTLGAYSQSHVIRLLGYASIVQMGLALLGLSLCIPLKLNVILFFFFGYLCTFFLFLLSYFLLNNGP